MIDNPIFVIGSARSGTVFLGEILKDHPDIHCTIEKPDVFNYASYLALNQNIKETDSDYVKKKLKRLYRRNWSRGIFSCRKCSKICKKSGGVTDVPWSTCHKGKVFTRYADKSHQHLFNYEILLDIFPKAQFIHILRDGRDVVSSMLRHTGVISWFSEKYINIQSNWPKLWFGVENEAQYREWRDWSLAKKCALRWRSWVKMGIVANENIPDNQILTIRYEELVTKPFEVGEEIFAYLGLKMHKEKLEEAKTRSIGKWKDRLTDVEISDALEIMKEKLKDIGYL